MRWRPLLWLIVSLFCFAGAIYFWNLGNEWAAQKKSGEIPSDATNQIRPGTPPSKNGPRSDIHAEASPFALLSSSSSAATSTRLSPAPGLPYRLSNTSRKIGQLARSPRSILLENALIDTERSPELAIPDSLRAQGDPGAYIVQAKGELDNEFRSILALAGATVIAYIPNNAYLVRATAEAARQLER